MPTASTTVQAMHVVPVVVATHASGPEAWERTVAAVAACLDRHSHASVVLRLPGAAIDHLAQEDRPLLDRLEADRVLWLAGGFSDPLVTGIGPEELRLQLDRERTAMEMAGITPGGLWVDGEWEPGLVSVARDAGHHLVFFFAELLAEPAPSPGPIERAGAAVVGVPVSADRPDVDGEGLAAVMVAPDALEEFLSEHGKHVTSVTRFLSEHGPGGRLAPRLSMPVPHPSRLGFYRKLMLRASVQPGRSPVSDALLRLQSREHLLDPAADDPEPDLLETAVALDRALKRGESWVEVKDVDFDADGVDEVYVETTSAALVVDPAEGVLAFWDDKDGSWPVTAVQPSVPAVLLRRLVGEEGTEPAPEPLFVQGRSQGRGRAELLLGSESGSSVRLELDGRNLSLELTAPATETVRMGPELPLRLAAPRLRVDGGPWRDADEPLAVSGHRFRLADDHHSILISALRPCEMFVHPLEGGGLVVWPHWLTDGTGTYHISMSPS